MIHILQHYSHPFVNEINIPTICFGLRISEPPGLDFQVWIIWYTVTAVRQYTREVLIRRNLPKRQFLDSVWRRAFPERPFDKITVQDIVTPAAGVTAPYILLLF